MPTSKKQKAAPPPFPRVRRDHATETAEDYVEAIAQVLAEHGVCRGADLARHFEVSHVTVSKIVARLKAEGLIAARPYGPLELTPAGRRLATVSQERHLIVLRFLRAIGVDEATAQADAEGIEHHVSKVTLARFSEFVARHGA